MSKEVFTRQTCQECHGDRVTRNFSQCLTCNGLGYVIKWLSIKEFLQTEITPDMIQPYSKAEIVKKGRGDDSPKR